MESKYSLTQGGNLAVIAGFIVLVLRHYRIEFISESEIIAVLGGLVVVGGVIASWYGRFRRGDLTIGGFRKT